MQLRTVKKKRTTENDSTCNNEPDSSPIKKNSQVKDNGERELLPSSNENSNLTVENDQKCLHKLRHSSNNYQGKYKKMNSGKYLYKLNSAEKKPSKCKRKQLRFIPVELIATFKTFLTKLAKKESETMLNQKKKREETNERMREKQKNGQEEHLKRKYSGRGHSLSSIGMIGNMKINYHHPYMVKSPYELYSNPNAMENLKGQEMGMESHPQMAFRMNNKDLMGMIPLQRNEYLTRGLYPYHHYEFEDKPKNDSIFNLINDKESLNRINKIANDGVNHIVAAFYIKSVQQSKARQASEGGGYNTANTTNSNTNINMNMNINTITNTNTNPLPKSSTTCRTSVSIPNNSHDLPGRTSIVSNQDRELPVEKDNSSQQNTKQQVNMNFFSDKFSPNVNEFTTNQIASVNDLVKKIKENKMHEIIEKR